MARILVVDDEEIILKAVSALLQNHGHETVTATTGNEARTLLLAGQFDLMICDVRMSPITGMDLLKLAHDACPAMPVIMLTAYAQVDTAIQALQCGAFDYVRKPFKPGDLLAVVGKALESRKYMESQ